MSSTAPANTTATRCPISHSVIWINNTGLPQRMEIGENGLLNRPYEFGKFRMSLTLSESDEFQVSTPFFVHPDGRIIPVELDGIAQDGSKVYSKSIPVLKNKQTFGRNASYFTHQNSNNVYMAFVAGTKLALFTFGIVSQDNRFYFFKTKKYEVDLYQNNGVLAIPGLPDWKNLPAFIAGLVEDIKSLPAVSKYQAPKQTTPAKLGEHEAEVLWCHPFGNAMAIRTNRGNAYVPYKQITNLYYQREVVNLPPGTIVRYKDLKEPDLNSRTTFPFIATEVTI